MEHGHSSSAGERPVDDTRWRIRMAFSFIQRAQLQGHAGLGTAGASGPEAPEPPPRLKRTAKAMETIRLGTSGLTVSRIGLGTWAMGGPPWATAVETHEAVRTIRTAIERGITLVDTAPIYGFGRSEELIGAALSGGLRKRTIIATKAGLEWQHGKVWRNASPARIRREVHDSLRRLRTDYIDLYQVHWPDPLVPMDATASELQRLLKEGKIRAIGVSNFSRSQIAAFRRVAPVHSVQTPYNLLERESEHFVMPYAKEHGMTLLCNGPLCRGLLTGTVNSATRFSGQDLQSHDPKFKVPRLLQYLEAVAALERFARERYGCGVLALAVRWVLDQGDTVALWGARRPAQLDTVADTLRWELDGQAKRHIGELLQRIVRDPVGRGFLAPPTRQAEALPAR
jgi:aryl-alcohol dehydrogenase-like predicted oxidoreductase